MSTLMYAALTNRRDAADAGTSKTTGAPGLGVYVDALAALVPAEVLSLHGLILTATTSRANDVTTITDAQTLAWSFYGLVAASMVLYATPRLGKWDRTDWLRVLIPPVSFVAWTMLQPATAFDAVDHGLRSSARTVIALFVASTVGFLAATLADRADANPAKPEA